MDPITVSEFAHIVGVTPHTVYNWINAGTITYDPVTKKCDREEALRLFLKTEMLYTPDQVAKQLFISPATVYRAIQDGRLPVIKRMRQYYIDPDVMMQCKEAILRTDNNFARAQRQKNAPIGCYINEAYVQPSTFDKAFTAAMTKWVKAHFEEQYDLKNPTKYDFPFNAGEPYTQSQLFKGLQPRAYQMYKKIHTKHTALVQLNEFRARNKGIMMIDGTKFELRARKEE